MLRGIDVSQKMVDGYNDQAQKLGFSREQMSAVRGDVLTAEEGDLDSPDLYDFDVAVLSMALHHTAEPTALLTKLVERLRPGGVLFVIDWAPSRTTGIELPSHALQVDETIQEQHAFSEESMEAFFSEAGCSRSTFRYVMNREDSIIPEKFCKVKGGAKKRAFLAWSKKN
jgi:SAM-dependent methyltransferase